MKPSPKAVVKVTKEAERWFLPVSLLLLVL